MRHRLRVCSDAVVAFGGEDGDFGIEAGEDLRDSRFGGGVGVSVAVRDDDERLARGGDIGAVQGVAADYVDVGGKVFFEGGDFGGFAGGLTADYGALFRCCEEGDESVEDVIRARRGDIDEDIYSEGRRARKVGSGSGRDNSTETYIVRIFEQQSQCFQQAHCRLSNRWCGRQGDHLQRY